MAEYGAVVLWHRGDAAFTDQRYSRAHEWHFDGGLRVPASSSPLSVPRYSDPGAVDPEEAFIASISSCHMLWFLSLAAKQGYVVDTYRDDAVGTMGSNAAGRQAIVEVVLRPVVTFAGAVPDEDTLTALHHAAHDTCYIANSVKARVRCEPALPARDPSPTP